MRPRHLGSWIAIGLGLAGLGALILAVNPAHLGRVITRFDAVFIPPIVACSALYYLLQGIRWQFLLRDAGARLPMPETIFINLVGQITSMLPLGELARVALAARASRRPFGDILATVTVQEMTYGLLLVVVAVPGMFEFRLSPAIPAVVLGGAALALAVLTFPPLFQALRRALERVVWLRRLVGALDDLQSATLVLLRRLSTLGWSVISLLQVAAMTTVFWLILQAVDPGIFTWLEAASVYAVATIAGEVSVIPGGIGASEATFAGVLIVAGVPAPTATAIALLQRLADQGVATLAGLVAYWVLRRRYDLGRLIVGVRRVSD